MGEYDRAGGFYDLVVDCLERTDTVCAHYNDMRLTERAAGIAATAARRWDSAEHHFRTALSQAERLPHLPEQAHTRRWYARMLLDRGGPADREEAARPATEATDLYRRMGMPRHVAMADALTE